MRAARSALIVHHLDPQLPSSLLISGMSFRMTFDKEFQFLLVAVLAISNQYVAYAPQQEIDHVD